MMHNKRELRNQNSFYKWVSKVSPRLTLRPTHEIKFNGKSFIKDTYDEIMRLKTIEGKINETKFLSIFLPVLNDYYRNVYTLVDKEDLYPHRLFLVDADSEAAEWLISHIKKFSIKRSKEIPEMNFLDNVIFVSCKNNYFVKINKDVIKNRPNLIEFFLS